MQDCYSDNKSKLLDFEAINDAADITEVAVDLLEMPHKKVSGRVLLLCPAHNDHNFGSCSVYKRRNIVKCFSCGASLDPIELVKTVKHCGTKEAGTILSQFYSIPLKDVDTANYNVTKKVIISRTVLEAIGVTDEEMFRKLFSEDRTNFYNYLLRNTLYSVQRWKTLLSENHPEQAKVIFYNRLIMSENFQKRLLNPFEKKLFLDESAILKLK